MDSVIKDFRDLEVWKRYKVLRSEMWALCKSFPLEEKYRLSDQIIRASRSVTACIAEGYGRFHHQENIQFCRQSRGSLYELIDHVDVAFDSEYIDEKKKSELIDMIVLCIRILNGYIRHLKKQKELNKKSLPTK
ncbi:four helix bundle protein [Desulfonatronum thioautotrophicum]|uniref:four helix bundle protein n=1 Tax=Desulfonatronum thioautotrophicum TaxID=617001 RepID=UPI0005EB75ED|nr:four helix bundle protein [Desulfonatronum thioautotrophicum]